MGRGTTEGGGGVFARPGVIRAGVRGACEYPSTSFADGCYAAGSGSRQSPGLPNRLHPPPHELPLAGRQGTVPLDPAYPVAGARGTA